VSCIFPTWKVTCDEARLRLTEQSIEKYSDKKQLIFSADQLMQCHALIFEPTPQNKTTLETSFAF
jgi:hypothetical protein